MRIELTDSLFIALTKLAEGNPGAVRALAELIRGHDEVSAAKLFCHLDEMGVYGPQIWIAYRYTCECDVNVFAELVLLRDKETLLRCDR